MTYRTKVCKICTNEFQPNTGSQLICVICFPDKATEKRWYKYGITGPQFTAMLVAQEHRCGICGATFDETSTMNKACVDHDHVTNRIRGLLCHRCNMKLHSLEDPTWRPAADAYLDTYRHEAEG